MSAAATERSAPQEETDREMAHRLKATVAQRERELKKARAEREAARYIALELSRSGIMVAPEDAPTRSLRAPGGPRGRRLGQEERVVAQETADANSLKAARKLLAAIDALRRARAELVSYELPGLLAAHELACDRVTGASARAEAAYIELIAALIEREEACTEENGRARAIVKAASSTLVDDDERTHLRHRATDEVPVRLDGEGNSVAWKPRPVAGLHGLDGVDWHPRNDHFYEAIADIVRGGRDRVRGNCGSERVAEKITKALRRN